MEFWKKRKYDTIEPDEIFIDSHNIPQYDKDQCEGRMDTPISKFSISLLGIVFVLVGLIFVGRIWNIQIVEGASYLKRSENNRLNQEPLFASRGIVYDRNGRELIWNTPSQSEVPERTYANISGLSHILGYVQYPARDKSGFYFRKDFKGVDGVEKYFNNIIEGKNGTRLIEVDALGVIQSTNIINPAQEGRSITLSIDADIQSELYKAISSMAVRVGFSGGAGIIMDIHNGEIIAMTSYPEYDPDIMSKAIDTQSINAYRNDARKPFLNRAIDGLYAPGSIVKSFVALAALEKNIISPDKIIVSTGYISIPNPYDPNKPTIFRDWKIHGPVDMRKALAVSSDEYFYAIGGGYKDQKGIGIQAMAEVFRRYGFGQGYTLDFLARSPTGTVPDPIWKSKTFNGEAWTIGNTYHTSIGQYGFTITPFQMARAMSALFNGGKLFEPSFLKDLPAISTDIYPLPNPEHVNIIREGLREAVTSGTARSLDLSFVQIAAKSGTAELGISKERVNSWMTGIFPYDNPKYAFAVVLESGDRHNLIGAGAALNGFFKWAHTHRPDLLGIRE